MKWAVIVVAYNSARQLEACLHNVSGFADRVIVVDNASTDGSGGIAEAAGAEVLALPENLGFGRACNVAARFLGTGVDWLVFVNPDVRIASADLADMLDRAPTHAAIVSPLLVDGRGAPLTDVARPKPSVLQSLLRHAGGYRLDFPGRRCMNGVLGSSERFIRVPVTSGACMAVRATAFHRIEGFDSAFFFNMEDVAISMDIAARLGGITCVDSRTLGVHHKASSSTGVPHLAKLFEGITAEYIYFLRTSQRGACLGVFGAFLVASGVARAGFRMLRAPSGVGEFRTVARFVARMCRLWLYCMRRHDVPRPNEGVFL